MTNNKTVQEIQEANVQACREMNFVPVCTAELFGLEKPLRGVEMVNVLKTAHPLAPKKQNVVWNEGLLRRLLLSMSRQLRDPIMLTGLKGAGKTFAINQIYAHLGLPLMTVNCDPALELDYLLGRLDFDGKSVHEVDGILSYCIRHGIGVCFDEISVLSPKVTLGLNDVLEQGDTILLKHYGLNPNKDPKEVLRAGRNILVRHPMFRMSATDNTGGKLDHGAEYVGRNPMDSSTRSRFTTFEVPYMKPELEAKALMGVAKNVSQDLQLNDSLPEMIIKSMVEIANATRVAYANGEAFEPIDFRQLQRWVTRTVVYDDIDEAFADSIYGGQCESDRIFTGEVFSQMLGRRLNLPEEYQTISNMITG